MLADMLLQGFGVFGASAGRRHADLVLAHRLASRIGQFRRPRLAALLAAMPMLSAAVAAIPVAAHEAPWPVMAGLGRLDRADRRARPNSGAGHAMFGIVGGGVGLVAECRAGDGAGVAVARSVALGVAQRWACRRSRGAVLGVGRQRGRRGVVAWCRRGGQCVGLAGQSGEPRPRAWSRMPPRRPQRRAAGGAARGFPRRRHGSADPMQPEPSSSTVVRGAQANRRRRCASHSSRACRCRRPAGDFRSLDLLKTPPPRASTGPSEEALQANARLLETVLSDYGVQGEIVEIRPGPVVTLYELVPAPGIRSARVIGLADDVARSLSVTAVRIATVPGRNVIGIEVPNSKRETVFLSEILASDEVQKSAGRLSLALGKDISGKAIVADLARMPHLMIAGTTGSGKSVGVNAMILSLLYRLSPDQCRMILIDPKMLELSIYEGIPHLMAPVVTEPAKAVTALKWTVREMERRYRAMSQLGVRNVGGYQRPRRRGSGQGRGRYAPRADRIRSGYRPSDFRGTAAGAGAAAVHRRGGRRNGRSDDGGRARRSSRRCSGWRRWLGRRGFM